MTTAKNHKERASSSDKNNKLHSLRRNHRRRSQPLQPVSASHLQIQQPGVTVSAQQNIKKPRITKLLRHLHGPGLRFEHPTCFNQARDRVVLERLLGEGITTKAQLERVILGLLFESRILVDWTVTNSLVDVFGQICKKLVSSDTVDWPANLDSADAVQLFHAVMRARLDWLKNPAPLLNGQVPCAVAVRVDKLIKWMGGVDDLMEELETFVNLAIPTVQAMKRTMSKPRKRLGRED